MERWGRERSELEVPLMKQPIIMAAMAAALLFGACFLLLRGGADPDAAVEKEDPGKGVPQDVVDGAADRQGPGSRGLRSGGTALRTDGLHGPGGGAVIPEGSTVLGRGAQPGRRVSRRGGGAAGSGASGKGGAGQGDSSEGREEGSGEVPGSGTGILAGGRLSQALVEALESEELGPLQGLLISGLTEDGTRFSAEDLPALFDALVGVDDFGMEKLILTHLERIEGLPEDKMNGYLDYLASSRKPGLLEEVLDQMVKVGGDASFYGLRELMQDPSLDRYRSRAAQALGELGDSRAVSLLDRALYSVDDPRGARPYVEALGKIGGMEGYASLVGYVSREGHEASLSAIYRISDPEVAPYLAETLNEGSSAAYQKAALLKLRTLSDPRILNDLSRYLSRAEATMARSAIEVVGRIYDPAAIRILESFARNQTNARLAAQALRAASRVRARLENPPPQRSERRPG